MSDVTVLFPIHRDATEKQERWLKEAIASLPAGTPYLVLRNDGEVMEALNEGIKAAQTEYVFPMGSDDLLKPNCLDMLLGPAWNADVVYPAMLLTDEELKPFGYHEAEPFCPYRLQQMNFVSGDALLRREKALSVGGFRTLGGLEDWDLYVRLHRAGARFKPCPQAEIVYRIREDGYNAPVRNDPELRDKLRREIIGEPDPLDEVQATFYVQATPAVTYLRAQLPAKHLPGMTTTALDMATNGEDFAFPNHYGKAAIFLHPGDKSRALAMQGLRAKGIRALVEVDDNYLINPGQEILKNSGWSLSVGDKPYSREGHTWITKHADGVIVTTRHLANSYLKVNPNVFICPNTVEPSDWPAPEKPDDGIFRIAWVGSLSHKPDIPLVTRAFEWASRQKDVQVYVSGGNPQTGAAGLDPGWKFPHSVIPWVDDLDAYRSLFQYFDVLVAPILGQPFALYRSDVKALEGAMGGCALVLSDVEPYEDWTEDRCLKAKDAKGFLHALKHLVANRDEAKQLAKAARDYALADRTTEAQVHLWRQAIDAD